MSGPERPSVSEAVRRAVERTFAATVGSAGVTREKAQELVDEVVRHGEVGSRRAGELRNRLREAIQDLSFATGDDIKSLRSEVQSLADRVTELERLAAGEGGAQKPRKRGRQTGEL